MILDNHSLLGHAECFTHGTQWIIRMMQHIDNRDNIDRVIFMGKTRAIISYDRDLRLRADHDVHPLELQIRADIQQQSSQLAITAAYIQNGRLLWNQCSKVFRQRFNATSMNIFRMNRCNQTHESPNY